MGENPYPALGRAALGAMQAQDVAMGSVGAGTGASTMMLKGGIGTASAVVDGITVGALVAANPVGAVTTPGERHFWAAPFEIGDEFGGLGPDPAPKPRDFSPSRARWRWWQAPIQPSPLSPPMPT